MKPQQSAAIAEVLMDPALIPALYDALTVARTGSVGAAARRLNKTPSAVSQQIRHLSEALGVTLFERRGRGLVPTQAAQQVLPAATRLFDEAEVVFGLAGQLSGSTATTLRIAASDYFAKPLLVPVLHDLVARGAPLFFEISTVHSEEALVRLERGEVDMAIVSHGGERSGLAARTLFDQPFYWIAPRRRGVIGIAPRRRGKSRKVVDRLAEEPLLRLAPGSIGRRLLDRSLEEQGIRPVSSIDVPSVSLLLAYASGGVGIGLVPALPLETTDLRRVVLERANVPALPVKLLTRAANRPLPAVERFLERLLLESTRCSARLQALAAALARRTG